MRRAKLDRLDRLDTSFSLNRKRLIQILIAVGLLYLLLVTFEIPFVFKTSTVSPDSLSRPNRLNSKEVEEKDAPSRPFEQVSLNSYQPTQSRPPREFDFVSGLVFDPKTFDSELYKPAKVAWEVGRKFWDEVMSGKVQIDAEKVGNRSEACKHSISVSGSEFSAQGRVMVLPCGLTLGSHITLVGRPRAAHQEFQPNIALVRDGESSMVSQFKVELLGLKTVEGEEPPRLLHFNPRLRGDWSGRPVIELNTCYRMQWGSALRCEGWKSKADEETVDGQVKCEKWIRDDNSRSVETKATWWLIRLVGRTKKVPVDWPYPFAEKKLFVLTLTAGLEGYHVNVDGRHVTSFPYHMGFSLEDATGLSLSGDVDVQSVFAASLPSSHPSFAPQKHLEMSTKWQAPPLPDGGVELFIGILSAGNHFAERMAVRKSWMQHNLIRSSKVVARFFVALHAKKEVNVELKKEAEFFGDIVIVPYMDNYDLVVLKTVAICEYGARRMAAKYIMKCDDDTFIRVDAVIKEAYKVPEGKSLYVGNINYYHKPLRYGKWAVTYEEWPEEDYPPYANGPGYILSSDIANFIVSEFESRKLRLFKMEDVSMGMWVEKFNSVKPVKYVHSLKFCQFGMAAKYIMKCDDDTFIRVDAVIKEAYKVPEGKSLYVGNINYYHKPLRYGKWAVTYEEWPEEDYPPYANGPGYILSSDIANFIVSEFESRKLRLFKMEDVSMGMWVEKFNSVKPVKYVHSLKFCQFGCVEDYYTAHYQSPRQMICMWDKLKRLGRPQCCSMR